MKGWKIVLGRDNEYLLNVHICNDICEFIFIHICTRR